MSEVEAPYNVSARADVPFCLSIVDIARIGYDAMKALKDCQSEAKRPEWDILPRLKKDELVGLARWVVMTGDTGPEDLHQRWLENGRSMSSVYGYDRGVESSKNPGAEWTDLTEQERAAYILFWSVARSMGAFIVWPE